MSQTNPIRLFVTHLWENSDDYLRVFEYLESARNFFYVNSSKPELRPDGDKEAQKEGWRKQMAPVEVVIGLSSLYEASQDLADVSATVCAGQPEARRADEAIWIPAPGAQGDGGSGG